MAAAAIFDAVTEPAASLPDVTALAAILSAVIALETMCLAWMDNAAILSAVMAAAAIFDAVTEPAARLPADTVPVASTLLATRSNRSNLVPFHVKTSTTRSVRGTSTDGESFSSPCQ